MPTDLLGRDGFGLGRRGDRLMDLTALGRARATSMSILASFTVAGADHHIDNFLAVVLGEGVPDCHVVSGTGSS